MPRATKSILPSVPLVAGARPTVLPDEPPPSERTPLSARRPTPADEPSERISRSEET
jgi:hypothetical protein